MIAYFSGTGNTRHAAEVIGRLTGLELTKITGMNYTDILDGNSLGIMFPVYSWGIPAVVDYFIANIPDFIVKEIESRDIPVWICCTHGDEAGLAVEMTVKNLQDRGIRTSGTWSVTMPNNYVILPGFDVDSKELEKEKIINAEERLRLIAKKISDKAWENDVTIGSWPRLKSRIVYPLFRKWGIFPKKWKSCDNCIKCGKCSKVCPMNNISLREGRPVWGENCVSCLACYHYCPVKAIQYGDATRKKGHYHYPEK